MTRPANSGRKKGTGNLVTTELKDFFRIFYETPRYQTSLKNRLVDGRAGGVEVFGWQTAVGKPKETIDVGGPTLGKLYAIAARYGFTDEGEDAEGPS